MIYKSVLELIGNTPIVKLNRIGTETDCEIFVKLESFNPMSSIKDRIALSMVEDAEEKGILKRDMTIVEPTSGNTGIGIAMVGAVKGYDVLLIMPDTMSGERKKILKAFGANLLLTHGSKGMNGAIEEAEKIVNNNQEKYFILKQFENTANPMIHETSTAVEILQDVQGRLDYFVSGVGTGGTLTGVGKKLKEEIPDIRVVAVEPVESPVISTGMNGSHKIQGIGAGFIPEILDVKLIDEIITVSYEECQNMAKRLSLEEGIFAGISSGASLSASVKCAEKYGPKKRILTILPDTGERYLSTGLFD